ncbi:hypothetical protein GVN24_32155 [Rhizobium sp. CRIBSB]|nr:hypothetical protein [Rhizobium sp. CRIBSB]
MIVSLMAMAALMGASDPDGVILTAPTGTGVATASAEAVVETPDAAPPVDTAAAVRQSVAHGLTTDEQIARWVTARREDAARTTPFAGEPEDDRQMHGEVWAGIGTGGYRDYGASVSLPLGESGRLDITVQQTKNDFRRRFYPHGYDPYEVDYLTPWGHTTSGFQPAPLRSRLPTAEE